MVEGIGDWTHEDCRTEKAVADRATPNATNNTSTAGDVRTGTSQAGSTPTPGTNSNTSSASTGLAQDNASELSSATQRVVDEGSVAINNALGGTGITITGNAANPIVASGESESAGSTQAGSANNFEEAGREAINTNTTTPADTRTGQADTTLINFNALGGA